MSFLLLLAWELGQLSKPPSVLLLSAGKKRMRVSNLIWIVVRVKVGNIQSSQNNTA